MSYLIENQILKSFFSNNKYQNIKNYYFFQFKGVQFKGVQLGDDLTNYLICDWTANHVAKPH